MRKLSAVLSLLLVLASLACATGSRPSIPDSADVAVGPDGCHPEVPMLDVRKTGGTPPKVLTRVEPRMPDEIVAQPGPVYELVIVEAVIDATGKLNDVCALKGDPRFVHAALEAVRQWTFSPATVNAEPVAVRFNMTVQFRKTGRRS